MVDEFERAAGIFSSQESLLLNIFASQESLEEKVSNSCVGFTRRRMTLREGNY